MQTQFGFEVGNINNGSATQLFGPNPAAFSIKALQMDASFAQVQEIEGFAEVLMFGFVSATQPTFRSDGWPIWPGSVQNLGPVQIINPHGFAVGGGGLLPNILFCNIMKTKAPDATPHTLFIPYSTPIQMPIGAYLGIYLAHNGQPGDIEVDIVLQT